MRRGPCWVLPSRQSGETYDVWALSRDPAHLGLAIVIVGPGGGGGAGTFRSGEWTDYALVVAYDDAGRVARWRWVGSGGIGMTSGSNGPTTPPWRLEKKLAWQSDQVLFTSGDAAVLVDFRSTDHLKVETLALADGRVLTSRAGVDAGCGMPLHIDREAAITFAAVPEGLLSVPSMVSSTAAPCLWRMDSSRWLEAVRLDQLVVDGTPLSATLAGDLVVRANPEGGLALLDTDGSTLATLPPDADLDLATADATGRYLLLRIATSTVAGSAYWLFDRDLATLRGLDAMARHAGRDDCWTADLALAPGGGLAAIACQDHVQLWTLDDPTGEPRLADILGVPADIEMGGATLGFSPDGERLVLGPHGFIVWRTEDWAIEAYLSAAAAREQSAHDQPAARATAHDGATFPLRLAVAADGAAIATPDGLWHLVTAVAP